MRSDVGVETGSEPQTAELVALARALIRRPRLLVLDEPCASMDDAALALTSRILLTGKAERVTFIVTHDCRTLAHPDRVLHLAAGRVRWIGGAVDSGRRCQSAA